MRGEEEEGEGGKGEKGGVNLVTLCPYTGSCYSVATTWASKSKTLHWQRVIAEGGEKRRVRGRERFERKGQNCELRAPGVKKVGRRVPHFPHWHSHTPQQHSLGDNIKGPGLRLGSDGSYL